MNLWRIFTFSQLAYYLKPKHELNEKTLICDNSYTLINKIGNHVNIYFK